MRSHEPKIVGILQARMGSSRLPGKVLALIKGLPMLEVIVKRLAFSRTLASLVVATTTLPADDAVCSTALKLGVKCFRGSEEDLLDRYYQAAREHKADVVVRLTADNPVVDSDLVDSAVEAFLKADPAIDYLASSLNTNLPLGISVEVFSFEALEKAWKEDTNPAWREHVTTHFLKNPHLFRMSTLDYAGSHSSMRLTVDTPEDLALIRLIFETFGHHEFSWKDAVELLEKHPGWLDINRGIVQRSI